MVGRRIEEAIDAYLDYEYRLLDRDDREIIAFHRHPFGFSTVVDPYLYLSGRLDTIDLRRNQEPLLLADMHIPTGFVTLEDVVRLLITEFGIEQRHTDWDTILREHRIDALKHQAS